MQPTHEMSRLRPLSVRNFKVVLFSSMNEMVQVNNITTREKRSDGLLQPPL